jgi:predicted nucleic acid-binding protein
MNASPVIALARVGQVELLVRLPKQFVIPRSVADEMLQAPEDDPARRAIEGSVFKIIETLAPPAQILAWDLGQGETARRCARSLSLMLTGILAVVLLAKQYRLIDSAAQVLHDLCGADFRLDDNTIRGALERTVGKNGTRGSNTYLHPWLWTFVSTLT